MSLARNNNNVDNKNDNELMKDRAYKKSAYNKVFIDPQNRALNDQNARTLPGTIKNVMHTRKTTYFANGGLAVRDTGSGDSVAPGDGSGENSSMWDMASDRSEETKKHDGSGENSLLIVGSKRL
ncbi:hypothetical protein ACFE04_003598 [Oxalis oulophora]